VGDIWGSIKDTAKSVGGAMIAPVGVVYDLAAAPLDDEDDGLGTLLASLSKRGGDFIDPLMNPETVTGFGFTKTMEGANWLLREGISEPISTALTLSSHASEDGGWGSFFSGEDWGKAYEIAQTQNAGQSFAFAFGEGEDPFTLHDEGTKPYDDFAKDHTVLAPTLSWGANIVGAFVLDPFAIAGKSAGIAKSAIQSRELSNVERANAYTLLNSEATRATEKGRQSRFDRWLDWTEGKNSLGRPLEAPEILHGTPELRKYTAEPHIFAGLMADANKITDDVIRRDTKRRIMAVAAGDSSQITRIEREIQEGGAIADTLRNMAKGGTLDLKRLATDPSLAHNPGFIAHLERQLDNINNAPDSVRALDKFVDGYNARLGQILDSQGTLRNMPGVHAAGKRAVKRQNDIGAARSLNAKHTQVDEWAAKHWGQAQAASSLYQKGLHSVPLLVVKTVGMPASVYTKFPVKVSDALRQTHFTGVANLHDWGGATTQLDSMMRLSNVPHGERMKTLSQAFLAKSEPEKQRIIDQVENLSMRSLADSFSAKHGTSIDRGFIEDLMRRHAEKRGLSLAQMRGRAYASTEMPGDMAQDMMALRGKGVAAAEDAATRASSTGASATPDAAAKWKPRVDQILDDQGVPVALPLLETQLANSVPLLDMGLAKTLLEREHSHMSRLSKVWAEDAKELKRLSDLKGRGHKGLDRAIAARRASMDWAVNAGQHTMRVWKFGVLFRLGYPMRVLMDDHWRIWTQMHAATFYGDNGKEFLANWRYNRVERKAEGRRELHDLKVRRHEILDELEGDRMVTHLDRQTDLKRIKREMSTAKGQITKLNKRLELAESQKALGLKGEDVAAIRARIKQHEDTLREKDGAAVYMQEQLGDYGPDELKRELEQIEDAIVGGAKALRPEKKMIGQADVNLPGGLRAHGAFAGPYGHASLEATKSHATFDTQLNGVEDRMYSAGTRGSHRTIQGDEAGHLDAWADTLNNQFRQSQVAMHFVKGGTVDEFVAWVKAPEQAQLRERLSHYAHDPEDWGHRVQALVHDYIPSAELQQAVVSGRVSTKFLSKHFQDPAFRPAVHGRVIADNLGTSGKALGISKAMNSVYRWIGEMPTDRLSRHPFFNSMYKQHLNEQYEIKRLGYAAEGRKFTQDDVDDLSKTARKLALHDLKRTLFDISAHSHAAHVMRFVSPFFAAHQEVLSRWWRIVGDNPAVVRRFAQAFDLPRHLQLVVDEDGELVKPGDAISREHRLLLQLPKAFGGPETDINKPGAQFSKWTISENSFNLILQGGLANPGVGPLVAVPVEYLARKYADEPEIARVARIFNPYPPNSPMDAALPATLKRLAAISYSKGGPGFGVGVREYNASYSQNVQDLATDFALTHGREPNQAETKELMLRAGRETNADMVLRFLWNAGSPAPASPRSKYSAIQHGWYQIQEQARAEGRDYDWAYAQFKDKWGEAYMPLVYSSSNNPAHLTPTAEAVAGIKRYRGVLDRVDPALTRMVLGAYADEANEYSPEASAFLRNSRMKPGSGEPYFSNDEPVVAMEEQMARRGWQKYGELTGALTAQAQAMGLNSYRESDQLEAVKRLAVAKLRQDNWAFDKDYRTIDSSQFDRYLNDMRTIVKSPALAGDTERQDIKVLSAYLQVRDYFVEILEARKQSGFGGPDAQANAGIRAAYTAIVGQLVESNTQFETYMYNGTLERDPLLVGDE
jgi:hypothetical protein